MKLKAENDVFNERKAHLEQTVQELTDKNMWLTAELKHTTEQFEAASKRLANIDQEMDKYKIRGEVQAQP